METEQQYFSAAADAQSITSPVAIMTRQDSIDEVVADLLATLTQQVSSRIAEDEIDPEDSALKDEIHPEDPELPPDSPSSADSASDENEDKTTQNGSSTNEFVANLVATATRKSSIMDVVADLIAATMQQIPSDFHERIAESAACC